MGEVNDSYCIPEIKGTGIESDETAAKILLLRIKLTEASSTDYGKVAGEVFPRLINILDEFFVLLQSLSRFSKEFLLLCWLKIYRVIAFFIPMIDPNSVR